MTDKEWNLPDDWRGAANHWSKCHPDYRMGHGYIEHAPTGTRWPEPGWSAPNEPRPDPSVEEWRLATSALLPKGADPVNLPPHYRVLPVECIDVTEHFNFCMGNAIKYLWRADHKGNPIQDLRKAIWYLEREVKRREGQS